MRFFILFLALFIYLCPLCAQIDSIHIINHGYISTLSSDGYWDQNHGISFPAYSISIYNQNIKRFSYSINEVNIDYRDKSAISILFSAKQTKEPLIEKVEFKVNTVFREEFIVEGISLKTLDRRYNNKLLLHFQGDKASGIVSFNKPPKEPYYRILEPFVGKECSQALLQDSSFFEIVNNNIVDVFIDKGPYYINNNIDNRIVYHLCIPKGWNRIAYSTEEIIIIYPRGERIFIYPEYDKTRCVINNCSFIPEHLDYYESGNIPFPVRQTLKKKEMLCSITGYCGEVKLTVLIRNNNKHIKKTIEAIISSSQFCNKP